MGGDHYTWINNYIMNITAADADFCNTCMDEAENRPNHWGGVYAITLCVFALVASYFMPLASLDRYPSFEKLVRLWAGSAARKQ